MQAGVAPFGGERRAPEVDARARTDARAHMTHLGPPTKALSIHVTPHARDAQTPSQLGAPLLSSAI